MKNYLKLGTKFLLTMSLSFLFLAVEAQERNLSGKVLDENDEGLPGVSIIIKDTNIGTITNFNGAFDLNIPEINITLIFSAVGYTTQEVVIGASSIIDVTMEVDIAELSAVVVTSGVIDIAVGRKTPIAVSSITSKEILLKSGNLEFPEIMSKTPGVYATKQGGGYGDSRISLRGFDQTNTSILINGQPVNDMENGRLYWSNWQGLTDVTSGIQIQRGLGATKLAVPSVGGTISIFTKAVDKEKGGSASQMIGNNGYQKTVASYNSGKSASGWATSVLLAKWSGDGYINNTSGEGFNYFTAIGYAPEGSDHELNFSFLGAGQWHHQRDVWVSIRDYQNFGTDHKDGIDRRWNTNGGTLDGEEFSMRRNFYNKPLATFNWDYKINSKLKLATSLYGSAGRGGGTGPRGNNYRATASDILPFRKDLTEHNCSIKSF